MVTTAFKMLFTSSSKCYHDYGSGGHHNGILHNITITMIITTTIIMIIILILQSISIIIIITTAIIMAIMAIIPIRQSISITMIITRLEPNMLKNLPIIPTQTSQIITYYSYFIPITLSIIVFYSIV